MKKQKGSRTKSKAYLRHVRQHPCLICASPTVDAHHLLRAEGSGFGLKSGDQWAVPLCRAHHMELHRMGDERLFFDINGIDPIEWAKDCWLNWNNDGHRS